MKILRTPDDRFAGLPGWPYEPRYATVPSGDGGTLRVHYVDEGPRHARPVLLLHGEPTWSYLYRKVIDRLVDAGLRAIAPDLVGFGRSDKPADREDYTYQRHVDWTRALVETLGVGDLTLVGHDWGGLIGLRVAAEHPERFAAIVAANTGLPTGDRPLSEAFHAWRRFSQEVPELPVGAIISRFCTTELPAEVVAAYEAPFPGEELKAGARQFPVLVPASADDPAAAANRRAWELLARWEKPFLTAFSDGDPLTRGADRPFWKLVPGARDQPHVTIAGAGHFLQEDRGEELAAVIARFVSM